MHACLVCVDQEQVRPCVRNLEKTMTEVVDRITYFLHDVEEFPSLRILSDVGVCGLSPELKQQIQRDNREGALRHCMNAMQFEREDEEEEQKDPSEQYRKVFGDLPVGEKDFKTQIEILVDKEYHTKDYIKIATDTDGALVVLRDIADDELAVKLHPQCWLFLRPDTHFRVCSGKTNVWSLKDAVATELEQSKAEREYYHLPYWERSQTRHRRSLVVDLCREFYYLGWCTGTGGSISIRQGSRIYMAPSGVQKERMKKEDIFVLDMDGRPLYSRPSNMGRNRLKISECCPLFFQAYRQRNAGACLHSHASEAAIASLVAPESKDTKCSSVVSEFQCTQMEMIKGISGHGYNDILTVPIVDNTPHECELTSFLEDAIVSYPKTQAVLVRRHGVYVWGDTWEKAKTQAECYHYLFQAYAHAKQLGIERCILPKTNTGINENGVKYVLLDIEGTTTSIDFVSNTLFPYAQEHLREHLEATWSSSETQEDVSMLQQESGQVDGERPSKSRRKSPTKSQLIDWCVDYVHLLMKDDKKSTALKQLQGRIWREAYNKGSIKGHVYPDTVDALKRWRDDERKRICIYSSGSCEAQKLLFGHSKFGDLTHYITDHFDTTTGNKKDKDSYTKIQHELGVARPSQIRFYTDSYEEAVAASKAGLLVTLVQRPGNPSLPADNNFPVITSFDQE